MSKALFRVIRTAPLTQLQDAGRFGHLHLGFSHSGPMDESAFAINQQLLGDDGSSAQLEFAPGGLMLEVLADVTIALSGAYMQPMLNGKPLVNFCAHQLKQGDRLDFGFAKRGIYAYLAVKGGFAAAPILGSRSSTARLNLHAQQVQSGTVLRGSGEVLAEAQGWPRKDIPDYQCDTLEVIPACQYEQFSAEMRELFSTQTYRVSTGDRMGTRLQGDSAISYDHGELLSEGLVPGAIQITREGQPIVLQKDAQSIGGYPKIGVLTEASRSLLAQMNNGRELQFRFV
ncbi:biotin-dependent carboxyltransferase family protein [Cardiobacteriaceae bacterium TAE3-ERU3]|nr:biotin-dependent carboxyltransferase family protein [Cardiobacteriaceae bacterium TAE3-ERU3]